MLINRVFRWFPFLKNVSDCSDYSAAGQEKRTETRWKATSDRSWTRLQVVEMGRSR